MGCLCIEIELEFGMLVFVEGKTGEPGEGLGTKTRTNNKLNTLMTPSPGHIGEGQVLSPLHNPCSPYMLLVLEG